jgi:hypothetical protein
MIKEAIVAAATLAVLAKPVPVSGTTLATFNPYAVPYQGKVVELVRRDWDYSKGNLEILLSGSYGSAKSILMAHLAVTHCLENARAGVLLARKSLSDIKETIFKEIVEHLEDSGLVLGVDYWVKETNASVRFKNGSEIKSISWSDKKYKKGRSRKISMLVFEELTENNLEDREAFMTLKARLRRLPHVKENVLIAATNPDAPSHWAYEYFFTKKSFTKFVFKSVTSDNPFLDPVYIEQLMRDLDPKAVQRYIYGEWIELSKDQVYYNYDAKRNFPSETFEFLPDDYKVLKLCHDFNIGKGKPMSAAAAIMRGEEYHFFKSFHVEGARTADIMDEIADTDLLDQFDKIEVYGDASGNSNDTRSIETDYLIIEDFLSNYVIKSGPRKGQPLVFEMKVPRSNPPIRRRHNLVNAFFLNNNRETRLYVYDSWIDKGMRLTAFKKDSFLIEDDSLSEQHVTTAIGYMIDYDKNRDTGASSTIQL